jgi:hypothetical protein
MTGPDSKSAARRQRFWKKQAAKNNRRQKIKAKWSGAYRADSISNPQASRRASGMYFEFLFRLAHSRRRVDRMYWSGLSLNSFTICSKEVTVGTTGPMGSGLPQFGFPRRFAIDLVSLRKEGVLPVDLEPGEGIVNPGCSITFLFYGFSLQKSIAKLLTSENNSHF